MPLAGFNLDTEQARASIRKVAALEPSVAWPGHADAVTGDVRAQLERAASETVGVGRRSRRRGAEQLAAPESPYDDAEGNVLVLRGAMTPATRAEYAKVRGGGLNQEDAWQRSVEFLFERLAVRWEIAGTEPIERQRDLLARYRFAGGDERAWIREVLRDAPRRALPGPRGAVRIVDLSVPTGPGPGEPLPPTIDYEDHERSAPLLAQIFGCEPSDLPDGQGWASETVTLITHAGTHVDAPYHYFPTSGGERARTIDELPLDWFLRPGVRLDLRERPWGERIEVEHLEAALAAAGHTLAPYDIVLLWTGAERGVGHGRVLQRRLRPHARVDDVAARAGREGDRDRRLGARPPVDGAARRVRADRRRLDPVGGAPRRDRPRVLPDREAPQPRRAARRPPASPSPACRSRSPARPPAGAARRRSSKVDAGGS